MVYSRIPSVERNHNRRLSTLFTVFYELFIDVIHATYYPEDGSSSQLDSGSFAQAGWWERTCLDGYMQYLVRNELSNIWSIYEYRFEQDIQRY